MNAPLSISLVVCAYNEEKYIGACLASIVACRGEFLEIIVVDNASTDNTRTVAESFPGVRVVSEREKGLTKARQRGLHEARGGIVAYIDADTEITEKWVRKIIAAYARDERIVCASGIYVYKDVPLVIHLCVWIYWHFFSYLTYLCTGYLVVGGNFAARKEALHAIGGFDTTIEFYGEDTDIARRLHKFGKVKFLPGAVVHTSARRIKEEGLIKTGWIYVKNFFAVAATGKPATKKHADFR
ncbi:MAG: glycosyltransferase [Patescibacteria group bacterium]